MFDTTVNCWLSRLYCLGEAVKVVTDNKKTVFTVNKDGKDLDKRVTRIKKQIAKEDKNPYIRKKLEQRLAILAGSVAIVFVGANSKIELKEKKDRVEDAIYATKAALQAGIVSGGGVALLNASTTIKPSNIGEKILLEAIRKPFETILDNANMPYPSKLNLGQGVNVITGKKVNMIKAGIIDPVLVTKSALQNAVSVASTIISADCVISNMRTNESS